MHVTMYMGVCVCRDMFLVCPMKTAPIIVRKKKEGHDYSHSPIPTYGEVRRKNQILFQPNFQYKK